MTLDTSVISVCFQHLPALWKICIVRMWCPKMVKNQSSTSSNILWSSCCGQFHPSNTQIPECRQFSFPNVGTSMCSTSFIGGWVFWEPSWKWVVLPLPDTHCNCWHRHMSCKLWCYPCKAISVYCFWPNVFSVGDREGWHKPFLCVFQRKTVYNFVCISEI